MFNTSCYMAKVAPRISFWKFTLACHVSLGKHKRETVIKMFYFTFSYSALPPVASLARSLGYQIKLRLSISVSFPFFAWGNNFVFFSFRWYCKSDIKWRQTLFIPSTSLVAPSQYKITTSHGAVHGDGCRCRFDMMFFNFFRAMLTICVDWQQGEKVAAADQRLDIFFQMETRAFGTTISPMFISDWIDARREISIV